MMVLMFFLAFSTRLLHNQAERQDKMPLKKNIEKNKKNVLGDAKLLRICKRFNYILFVIVITFSFLQFVYTLLNLFLYGLLVGSTYSPGKSWKANFYNKMYAIMCAHIVSYRIMIGEASTYFNYIYRIYSFSQ